MIDAVGDAGFFPGRRWRLRVLQGCDASIMLISRNETGERDAYTSYGLRGYDEIEQIKAKVEAACPLTVSCADIIALAARDAVYLVCMHSVVTPIAVACSLISFLVSTNP